MVINFEGIQNARDLGGIKTANGRTVKSGLLFRTGELERATDADIAYLRAAGLRHIVDFRDPAEVAERPDRPVPGAEHHALKTLPALPVSPTPPGESEPPLPADPEEIFPELYVQLGSCAEAKTAYREFFQILLRDDGAVLWHCRQGKDRTGVAAVLLLTALNVPLESASADYLETNVCMRALYEDLVGKYPDPAQQRMLRGVLFVRADWLDLCLDRMRAEYGGLPGYLRGALGLTGEDVENLRAIYTE